MDYHWLTWTNMDYHRLLFLAFVHGQTNRHTDLQESYSVVIATLYHLDSWRCNSRIQKCIIFTASIDFKSSQSLRGNYTLWKYIDLLFPYVRYQLWKQFIFFILMTADVDLPKERFNYWKFSYWRKNFV